MQRRIALANGIVEPRYGRAEVAEQADASVSKTDVRKDVRVRLPISAPRLRVQPFSLLARPTLGLEEADLPGCADRIAKLGDHAVDVGIRHLGKYRQRQNPSG
jgi:hypothetical protein